MTPIRLARAEIFEAEAKRRARVGHMVVMSKHGDERGLQRGISRRQVRTVLLKGTLASGPTWDDRRGNWMGVMQHHAAGERIRVVCAMAERSEAVIVVSAY